MRLALFWSEIQHYHAARIRSLGHEAEGLGHTVYPFALRGAAPDLPVPGYHGLLNGQISVLAVDDAETGPYTRKSQTQVVEFLDQKQPDVVGIVGYSSPASLAALSWCRRRHRGAILMSESKAEDYPRSRAKEWFKRQIVHGFDSALVGGTPHIAYALSLGMTPDQVFTGYDAVDNEFWASRAVAVRSSAARWRAELGLPGHFFLTACRLVPKKNVDGLLRSYAIYAQHFPQPWPLVVAGDGRMRGDLQQLTHQLGLAEHVRFVGYLDAETMAPYYALASLFILASNTSEQWGLVVNEAMAAGTPAAVSKVCGSAPDLVIEGQTGFSFDPQDENELARLLAVGTQNPNDLERMRMAAQAHVARFSPEVFAQNFLAAANVAHVHARARGADYAGRLVLNAARPLLREPDTGLE